MERLSITCRVRAKLAQDGGAADSQDALERVIIVSQVQAAGSLVGQRRQEADDCSVARRSKVEVDRADVDAGADQEKCYILIVYCCNILSQ